MKNNYLLVLFILIFSVSCKQSPANKEKEFIASNVTTLALGEKVDWVVILPNLGCPGCIQEGEAFMRDHLEDPNVFFVITQLQSVKILQQKIGKKITGRANVLIDQDKKFDIPGENKIYPCIVQLDKGKMTGYQFQSPKNGQAFEQLSMKTALNGN